MSLTAFGSNSTKLDFSITCIGDGGDVLGAKLVSYGFWFQQPKLDFSIICNGDGGRWAFLPTSSFSLSLTAFGSNSTKLDFSITCIGDGRAVGIPSNLNLTKLDFSITCIGDGWAVGIPGKLQVFVLMTTVPKPSLLCCAVILLAKPFSYGFWFQQHMVGLQYHLQWGDGRAVGISCKLKNCGDVFGGKALSLMAFGSNSTKLDFSITCIGDGRAVGIPSNLKFLTKLDFSITCIGDGRAVGIPSNLKFLGDVLGAKPCLLWLLVPTAQSWTSVSLALVMDGRWAFLPTSSFSVIFSVQSLVSLAFGSNSTKLDFSITCNGDGWAVGIPFNLKFLSSFAKGHP
ncbi:hypothetical protein DM01DRAFT_1350312 [Hesseltinella vesiculosa]|uniref:Uncharacterized protein n=1 Tax=Hesseltinella vesiculosa TaxID=101127 RepID=A0A1X2G1Y3_9FUNG|nr:hypothetical protein DM01DRAFT_1350312 [Hesseltinella vesiculosa]